MEVRVVANLASVDIRRATGYNLFGIRKELKIDMGYNPLVVVRL
jgi:hypothetical protein